MKKAQAAGATTKPPFCGLHEVIVSMMLDLSDKKVGTQRWFKGLSGKIFESEEEEGETVYLFCYEDEKGTPLDDFPLFADHIEVTDIFRGWFCNYCNGRLIAAVDLVDDDEIEPFLLRTMVNVKTTAGGVAFGSSPAFLCPPCTDD